MEVRLITRQVGGVTAVTRNGADWHVRSALPALSIAVVSVYRSFMMVLAQTINFSSVLTLLGISVGLKAVIVS